MARSARIRAVLREKASGKVGRGFGRSCYSPGVRYHGLDRGRKSRAFRGRPGWWPSVAAMGTTKVVSTAGPWALRRSECTLRDRGS